MMRAANLLLALLTALAVGSGCFAQTEPSKPAASPEELRFQDQAFALLVAVLCEIKGEVIAIDHDANLERGMTLTNDSAAADLLSLSRQQSALREKELGKQVAGVQWLYAMARDRDERATGTTVSNAVDILAARQQLARYDVLDIQPTVPMIPMLPIESSPSALPPSVPVAHLALLRESFLELAPSFDKPIENAHAAANSPLLIQYRQKGGEVRDITVQALSRPDVKEALLPALLGAGGKGEDGPMEALGMWTALQLPVWMGLNREQPFPQLIRAAFANDADRARELTAEPLHVLAIIPQPDWLLPRSVSRRVSGVVLAFHLDRECWRADLRLVTAHADDAERVAGMLASWCELAANWKKAENFPAGLSSLFAQLRDDPVVLSGRQASLMLKLSADHAWHVAHRAAGKLQSRSASAATQP